VGCELSEVDRFGFAGRYTPKMLDSEIVSLTAVLRSTHDVITEAAEYTVDVRAPTRVIFINGSPQVIRSIL